MYDIFGEEILRNLLSKQLQNIKIKSFIFNRELVEEINTIYLNFGNWISIFFDDGVLFIKDRRDFKSTITTANNQTIEYKFAELEQILPNYNEIINRKLLKISKDMFKLTLTFEDENELIIQQTETEPGFFGGTTIYLSKK
jgi:hypothetical protein